MRRRSTVARIQDFLCKMSFCLIDDISLISCLPSFGSRHLDYLPILKSRILIELKCREVRLEHSLEYSLPLEELHTLLRIYFAQCDNVQGRGKCILVQGNSLARLCRSALR